ncbi:MAG: hypothetical protein ACO4CS_20055, partial [bacterium]
WWVREFCEWKSEEIEQFEVAPHPAFGHLFPDGEGQIASDLNSLFCKQRCCRQNLQIPTSWEERPSQ